MSDPKASDPRVEGLQSDEDAAKAEPWHAADEKPAARKRGKGAPIGTHSLTGGAANVGIPSSSPDASENAERSSPPDSRPGAEEPDPLAEPRASSGDLLGRKRR